jgi:hypothetical protein
LSYESAVEHWNKYGKKELRYSVIRHSDIEDSLNQYNNLKQRIGEKWYDYYMEQVIKMKIKGNASVVVKKFLYDNLSYTNIRNIDCVIVLISAISKWIFNDNYSEINALPRKNGYLYLSIFGIDINHFDSEYFYKSYKNCWVQYNTLEHAIVAWNIFGKNNNYLRSMEHELYEDLCFDWEYYVKANRLSFLTKIEAFLHWNKYGKRGGLISSNISLKKTYDEFIKNIYDNRINKWNIKPFLNSVNDNTIVLSNKIIDKKFNNPIFEELKTIDSFDLNNLS